MHVVLSLGSIFFANNLAKNKWRSFKEWRKHRLDRSGILPAEIRRFQGPLWNTLVCLEVMVNFWRQVRHVQVQNSRKRRNHFVLVWCWMCYWACCYGLFYNQGTSSKITQQPRFNCRSLLWFQSAFAKTLIRVRSTYSNKEKVRINQLFKKYAHS